MGLIAPFIVKGKIQLARLHLLGPEWDDNLENKSASIALKEEAMWWREWFNKYQDVTEEQFARCLRPRPDELKETQMHCFVDASEEAFAAVIYTRCLYNDGSVFCNLVMAKTRVAPRKTISVAKLELQAALLGVRLMSYVEDGIRFKPSKRTFWTDSSCVRHWVRQTASFYKPFVSNRIGEIQMSTKPEEWRHVPGKLNVADEATRSEFKPNEPLISEQWKSGPKFLYEDESEWPKDIEPKRITEELRPKWDFSTFAVNVQKPLVMFQVERWSTFKKADRVAAWTVHFIRRYILKSTSKQNLEAEDFELGYTLLIKEAQVQHYQGEIATLQNGLALKKSTPLISLRPFLDEKGILRVGGRIGQSILPYDAKHPVILNPKSALTKLIVKQKHAECRHAGTNYVLAILRQDYWIVKGRELVKKVRSECEDCKRAWVKPMTQVMCELPSMRVVPCAPFEKISLDIFGPIDVKEGRSRKGKRYGTIFCCMTTRAVHIEMIASLATSDFLTAFRIFCNMRGQPRYIYSDNATTFQGAKNVIETSYKNWLKDPNFEAEMFTRKIMWIMQPPRGPHFGGLHEALIKSAKRAMYQAMEDSKRHKLLKEGELRLIFAEVTNFLNARPLTYVGDDPKDLTALTPNHFLIHRSSPALPMIRTEAKNYRDNFKYSQQLTEKIWRIWSNEYLPTLTARGKWHAVQRNLKAGDRVLVVEDDLPRGQWLWGVVSNTKMNKDGIVRKASVKTRQGIIVRPITKLCLLEEAPDDVGYTLHSEKV